MKSQLFRSEFYFLLKDFIFLIARLFLFIKQRTLQGNTTFLIVSCDIMMNNTLWKGMPQNTFNGKSLGQCFLGLPFGNVILSYHIGNEKKVAESEMDRIVWGYSQCKILWDFRHFFLFFIQMSCVSHYRLGLWW